MFNKRHYQAIAQVIQDLCLSDDEHDEQGLVDLEVLRNAIARQFADMFAADNRLFKYNLFLQACLPGANVRATKVNPDIARALLESVVAGNN